MKRAAAFLEITRPVNSMMMGLAIIVGAAITGGLTTLGNSADMASAFITGFTLSGAAMAVNDYYDLEIDRVNEPDRPIPSGRVTPQEALLLTAALSVIGLIASYMISLQVLGIAVFSWIVMMVYSAWGKRVGLLGNLMVSTCIALPFIYGGVLSGSVASALAFSLMAFLTNTGREITKGIVDIEGDEKAGVDTVAVKYGPSSASRLAALFYVSAAVVSVAPIVMRLVSFWYVPFVAVTDVGLIHSSFSVTAEPSRENSKKVKTRVLYFMLIGLVGFAVGSLL